MRYTIELQTAAGALLVGLFDTLEAARTAATDHRCAIRPIIAGDLAALIEAPTAAQLEKYLTQVLDEPATLALRSTQAQHRAH